MTPEIADKVPGAGDMWLWVAIDADTKLVPCFTLGQRNAGDAHEFMTNLAGRLRGRVQMTSDGHRPYLQAVEDAFGGDIDYAMLVKLYGIDPNGERRYSPPVCLGSVPTVITGRPDPSHISTSYVERQNWTVRTTMRRYTRLSNGFSRKIKNHFAAVALNYFAYNFLKIHRTLRVTPAMAAGVTTRLFDVSIWSPCSWSRSPKSRVAGSPSGLQSVRRIPMIVKFSRYGFAVILLMFATTRPIAINGQAANAQDVSRFLGSWVGNETADMKVLQNGLQISTAGDELVVTSTFRRPPVKDDDPWTAGTTLAYKLDGSTSPHTYNGRPTATKLTRDGDSLMLTETEIPGPRGTPAPALGSFLRTLKFTIEGDRLKVEASEAAFKLSRVYDRPK